MGLFAGIFSHRLLYRLMRPVDSSTYACFVRVDLGASSSVLGDKALQVFHVIFAAIRLVFRSFCTCSGSPSNRGVFSAKLLAGMLAISPLFLGFQYMISLRKLTASEAFLTLRKSAVKPPSRNARAVLLGSPRRSDFLLPEPGNYEYTAF